MRVIVIGAVAAGIAAAVQVRRNDPTAEIVMYEKDQDISYAGCGLPYYIADKVNPIQKLIHGDPAAFRKKYQIEIKIRREVLEILPEEKTLRILNTSTTEIQEDSYDKLVIATGASPFIPPIEGIKKDHVFFLRTIQDSLAIKRFVETRRPEKAVIAGTGFIGWEMMESLQEQGIDVTMVEVADKITPNLDPDMAQYLENLLQQRGVKIIKSQSISEIQDATIILRNGEILPAALVIMATGVRPNTALAEQAGIRLGPTKAIQVNRRMETNLEDIYACGDCIETFSSITGQPVYRPLGTTANKTGRIAGDALTGGSLTYEGNLGTGIFRLLDLVVGSTGLSEKEATLHGYQTAVVQLDRLNKPGYFDGQTMRIKAVADRNSKLLLGVQIIGGEGVDRRLDVFATLITHQTRVEEFYQLDLGYAPPFSTAIDPVHYTGMLLDQAIRQHEEN